jgi:hypothetical protein
MAEQKFTIKVSKKMPEEVQTALGIEIIDFIIDRSKKGKDKLNKDFPSYSKDYKSSLDFKIAGKNPNKVDLTLTGEMLNSLEILDTSEGEITIGINPKDKLNTAKAEGNVTGSYGGKPKPRKARDFMGIHKEDLNELKKKYAVKTKSDLDASLALAGELLAADTAADSLAESFLFDEDF